MKLPPCPYDGYQDGYQEYHPAPLPHPAPLTRDPYLDNPYQHNPPISSSPALLWRDDVVDLTRRLVRFLENEVSVTGPISKIFRSGNDQINYGYSDMGLQKSNSKDKINFNFVGTQLSYVYRFFTSHVLIIGEMLLSTSGWYGILPPHAHLAQVNGWLDSLNSLGHVAITCFGGGPASELAAITAWLRIEGITSPLRFNIADKYKAWKTVAQEVAEYCQVELHYKELDFLTSDLGTLLPYTQTLDIICMSKFLSALTAHRDVAETNLRFVFNHMKPGAMFIYCDNSGGGTTEWVTTIIDTCELYHVFTVPHYDANIDPSVLTPNENRLLYNGVKPTSRLKVAFKVYMKGGHDPWIMNQDRVKSYHKVGNSSTKSY